MPVPAALDVDLIISLTFVGISAYIMQRAMRRLDPRISNERTTKASAVARRLLKGKGKMELVLREHEIEVAADVVCPDDIDVTFAEIGGLSEQAKQLQQAILLPVRRPSLFAQSKLFRSPKGILLHGPPGTGKTMLVRAIAREARFTFLCVNLARLFSKWYGESNKFAEAYFSLARKLAPSLIFIDEVDCVFSKGRHQEHEATSVRHTQPHPLEPSTLTLTLTLTLSLTPTSTSARRRCSRRSSSRSGTGCYRPRSPPRPSSSSQPPTGPTPSTPRCSDGCRSASRSTCPACTRARRCRTLYAHSSPPNACSLAHAATCC